MSPLPPDLRETLFTILLGENPDADFLKLIDELSVGGTSKQSIYELFLSFHAEIQRDSRTRNNEQLYDRLSEFMDGFTAWGKHHRILPDEPNI